MDRRNFFAAAGAASLILGSLGAGAAEPPGGTKFIKNMSDTLAGTQFDQDVIGIATKAAASFDGGPHHYPKKVDVDVVFGDWFAIIHIATARTWINTDEAFGPDYKTFTLSKMLAVAAKSKYATSKFALKVDRDGEVFVAS